MEIQTRVFPSKPAAQVCAPDAARRFFLPLVILSLSQLQSISNGLPAATRAGLSVRVPLDRFVVPAPPTFKEFREIKAETDMIETAEFVSELFYDPDEAKYYLAWVCKTITPAL